jgi:hypothetical protein
MDDAYQRYRRRIDVHCRIRVILARSAPVGVIFRRGPTRWVQIIRWDTERDIFEAGQWFNGRIYERRGDLSPDGSLMIYFASKINGRTKRDTEYTYAWTAIRRPPYLTALALWPKGDTWHGGGLFDTPTQVWLNHKPEAAIAHPHHLPDGLSVCPNPGARGEDGPVWCKRMVRDGWTLVQEGSYPISSDWSIRVEKKEVWERPAPDGRAKLRRVLDAISFKFPDALVESFWLIREGWTDLKIREARWADWDLTGRLVFAREGRIYAGYIETEGIVERELVDLNPNKPCALEAPDWARRW